jgi:hypothetical protein
VEDPIVPLHLLHPHGRDRQRSDVPRDRGAVLGQRVGAAVPADDDWRELDETGLLLIPAMLGITVSTTLSGRLITRTGRHKAFPIAGLGS